MYNLPYSLPVGLVHRAVQMDLASGPKGCPRTYLVFRSGVKDVEESFPVW